MPFLDLEYKVRTDGEFRHELHRRSDELYRLERLSRQHSKYGHAFNHALFQFANFCQFNLAFLAAFYFPRYPEEKPLSFSDYPFAFTMLNFVVNGFTVIKGSRQIGKSVAFAFRQLLNTRMIPGFKTMYICPRPQQLNTYATKMRQMEMACRDIVKKPNLRQNLLLKEYANGSSIELAYVLQDAGVIRGKTTREMVVDEAQDFDADLEHVLNQVQSATDSPLTMYAGTSLTTDTFLEGKWNLSSNGIWVMRCGCGHDNVPLPEFNVMDMIQPKGPCCVKCSRLLNPQTGHFVHGNRRMFDLGNYGFHVPQIILPSVYLNTSRWMKIYESKNTVDIHKFYQENLGIATEEGEREITKTHLMEICTLGEPSALQVKAKERRYQYVVSGCDWGGSDYNPNLHTKVSTTVHVVAGVRPDGIFEIVHMRRYAGMNYDDIAGDIVANHQKLSGTAIASDFGVGAVYNTRLRENISQEKHLIFNYAGPHTALISEPGGPHMFNMWTLNKTESISLTYDAVRRKRILCYNWELAAPLLTDFLNMYRAPGEKLGQTGATTFLYKAHPSKTNDTLQAVNYAFMLGRILLGEPLIADLTLRVAVESNLRGSSNYINGPRSYSSRKAFSR